MQTALLESLTVLLVRQIVRPLVWAFAAGCCLMTGTSCTVLQLWTCWEFDSSSQHMAQQLWRFSLVLHVIVAFQVYTITVSDMFQSRWSQCDTQHSDVTAITILCDAAGEDSLEGMEDLVQRWRRDRPQI